MLANDLANNWSKHNSWVGLHPLCETGLADKISLRDAVDEIVTVIIDLNFLTDTI